MNNSTSSAIKKDDPRTGNIIMKDNEDGDIVIVGFPQDEVELFLIRFSFHNFCWLFQKNEKKKKILK